MCSPLVVGTWALGPGDFLEVPGQPSTSPTPLPPPGGSCVPWLWPYNSGLCLQPPWRFLQDKTFLWGFPNGPTAYPQNPRWALLCQTLSLWTLCTKIPVSKQVRVHTQFPWRRIWTYLWGPPFSPLQHLINVFVGTQRCNADTPFQVRRMILIWYALR